MAALETMSWRQPLRRVRSDRASSAAVPRPLSAGSTPLTIIHFDANNDLTIAGVEHLSAGDFWFA
ncbi:hypothetical protein [Bradyrhizobium cenepequi]